MQWIDLKGHTEIKNVLREIIEKQRIGHAYIFEGKKGVGKKTAAEIFAREVVQCPAEMQEHPDIIWVTNARFNEKGGSTLSIETVRAVKRDVYIRPFSAERKVYIIPNADAMLPVAQNGLLKIFEEPPAYCTMILLAENANLFLPTIRSRATLLHFHPVEAVCVKAFLCERGIEEGQAETLSVMCGGSIGEALELLENTGQIQLRDAVIQCVLAMTDGGNKACYAFVQFLKKNRGEIELLFSYLESWFSDVLRYKISGGKISLVNIDKSAELQKFVYSITRTAAARLCETTIKYRQMIKQNANFSIAVLCMVLEFEEAIHGRNYRRTI